MSGQVLAEMRLLHPPVLGESLKCPPPPRPPHTTGGTGAPNNGPTMGDNVCPRTSTAPLPCMALMVDSDSRERAKPPKRRNLHATLRACFATELALRTSNSILD